MKKYLSILSLSFFIPIMVNAQIIEIAGPSNVCLYDPAEYTAGYINCGSNYKWNCTGCTFITPQNGNPSVTVFWSTSGNKTISVNYNGRRCSGKPDDLGGQSLDVNVIAAPSVPTSVNGPTCISTELQSLSYTVSEVLNADQYEWTISGSGWSLNSSTGKTITVNAPSGFTGATVCVRAGGSCGNSSYYCFNVTRNGVSDILYNQSCQNRLSRFSIPSSDVTSGATYNWTIPSGNGWSIAAGGSDFGQGYSQIDINIGTTSGDVCVTKSIAGCANSTYCEVINPFPIGSGGCSRIAFAEDSDKAKDQSSDEDFLINGFKVYPVPAKNHVYVDSPRLNENYKITIYNLYGTEIKSIQTSSSRTKIEVNDLQRGSYLIVLTSPTMVLQKKILVDNSIF